MLDVILRAAEMAVHETALFAAFGFLFLGTSDFSVDLVWIGVMARRRMTLSRRPRICCENLPPPARPGRLAIFVPAWDEAAVIGGMLSHAKVVFGDGDYRIYVGCYPNDPATLAVVAPFFDERLRIASCARPGPTSKADCLNQLWNRMCLDEAAGIM